MSKKRSPGFHKRIYGILAGFIALCLVVFLFGFQYYKSLYVTIRGESQSYLQEVSRRISENLEKTIDDNFAALYILGATLEKANSASGDKVLSLLEQQKKFWNFENLLLVDQTGTAYDITAKDSVFFAFEDSVRIQLLNKNKALTNTQMVNNKEYFIFSVPLNNVTIDGKGIIALAACYDPSALDQVLSMSSFNDQAYSQIVTKSGTVVTRATAPQALKSGYNIFSTLKQAELEDGSTLNQLQNEIRDDVVNQISFTLDGVRRYMVYTPIAYPEEWSLLTFVPSQVVNQKSEMLLQSTLIICGLIAAAFSLLVVALFSLFSANRRKLERIAYVDDITGGNTLQRFYQLAKKALEENPEKQFALLYSNIENFKVLNVQLGRKSCDVLLQHFDAFISSKLEEGECLGRHSADNFCILFHYTDMHALITRMADWETQAEVYLQQAGNSSGMPTTQFGIYIVENTTLSLPEMIDRAKMALKEALQPVVKKLSYAFYDDLVRRQLFREKQLSDMMEDALINREFQIYLQPKVRLPEEVIGGAEALVRWISASEGMIFPDEFIPLFERNGFIVRLDLYVFEEACRTMRSWIDQKVTPLKISVNCSRVHFKNPFFLTPYLRVADQYQIDHSLIEIELTESVVFENMGQLTSIIHEIHSAGFGCSMDDFGSGYSSLNLIQSIPVDTLKIDKIFFKRSPDEATRTETVVKSIVQMAQSLSLITVAEGVEYREQVEMLKRVGCDYVQGYVFAKPMAVSDFEQMAFPGRTLKRPPLLPTETR